MKKNKEQTDALKVLLKGIDKSKEKRNRKNEMNLQTEKIFHDWICV